MSEIPEAEEWYVSLSREDNNIVFHGSLMDALAIGKRDGVDLQWVFDAQNEAENVADDVAEDEVEQDKEDFAAEALDSDNDVFTSVPTPTPAPTPSPTPAPASALTYKMCRHGNACYGRKSGKCPFNHADA